jgi:CHAD domain-containing protein
MAHPWHKGRDESMAKPLNNTESGTKGVQRILRRQLDKVLETLYGEQPLADEAVHTNRKQLKKVRATLRLLRPALGSLTYQRENAVFRDAARPFATVRDAKVLLDTLAQLAPGCGAEAMALDVTPVRQALQEHNEAVRRCILKEDTLEAVQAALVAARTRVKQWPVGRRGWSILGRGLQRVYRNGRTAFIAAPAEPTAENLHEWRKHAKSLWHQLQILQPLQPARIKTLVDQAHSLADALGDDHDLAVLHHWLVENANRCPNRATADALMGRIAYRRTELQAQAFAMGGALYQEKPARFVAHFQKDWHRWREKSAGAARDATAKADGNGTGTTGTHLQNHPRPPAARAGAGGLDGEAWTPA